MYIKMRNDATTFNINQPGLNPPEKFVLPGVKVWKDSDSVIKNAKKLIPKPISVTERGAAAPPLNQDARSPVTPPVLEKSPAGEKLAGDSPKDPGTTCADAFVSRLSG